MAISWVASLPLALIQASSSGSRSTIRRRGPSSDPNERFPEFFSDAMAVCARTQETFCTCSRIGVCKPLNRPGYVVFALVGESGRRARRRVGRPAGSPHPADDPAGRTFASLERQHVSRDYRELYRTYQSLGLTGRPCRTSPPARPLFQFAFTSELHLCRFQVGSFP